MKETGARLVVETIRGLIDGSLEEKPQAQIDPATLKMAPKIFTTDCEINWHKPVFEINNQIRGLSPFPGAFTLLNDRTVKIYKARAEMNMIPADPGKMETDGKTWLRFSASDGYIYIEELQLEGKRKMDIEDFLRGYRNLSNNV